MGEEVETKERGRTWSPEQGSGEGTSDGHGNRDENGMRRKTVYFTDSGRQGVGRKGKRNVTPLALWREWGKASERLGNRVGQGWFPRLGIILQWRPPVSLVAGSQYNNLEDNHHRHQPPTPSPSLDLDCLHIHGWAQQIQGG